MAVVLARLPFLLSLGPRSFFSFMASSPVPDQNSSCQERAADLPALCSPKRDNTTSRNLEM